MWLLWPHCFFSLLEYYFRIQQGIFSVEICVVNFLWEHQKQEIRGMGGKVGLRGTTISG